MKTVKAWALIHDNGQIADVALTRRNIETKRRILRYEIPTVRVSIVKVEIRAIGRKSKPQSPQRKSRQKLLR